ncbi:MAG TPA: undecaprenyldiphospho-muramoylpentapeptide beta-N-acetylglucosaminyltransferase [Chthonomonadaceae bacterium]|nr:undecaprenyldiphospho-muramoylpentapeptide beta-N-acetylglucosaminyltransferase [Chthonomonadaceae bacterium]
MRVVVSGGGTGGHIYPALAIAEALKRQRPDVELLYIGGASGMETRIVPEYGVPFQAVTSRKLRKVLSPGTVGALLALWKGYREAQTYIRAFGANIVVGTGGYAAAATVLAGVRSGLPTLIHEGNALPGRTNRFLARYAQKVCVTFEETIERFPPGKAALTGLPLRQGIVAPPDVTPQAARCRFDGFGPDAFTVLVVGGSQGAQALNRVVLEAVPGLLDAGVQILHQTGVNNFEGVRSQAEERQLMERAGYQPVAFLDGAQMPLAFRAADVIVCRGGISTLSEALANGLPAVVVPLPTAYADHQTYNAKALVAGGAALLRPENELTASNLNQDLRALRDDPARRQQMAAASRAMGRPQAADEVAKLVLELT